MLENLSIVVKHSLSKLNSYIPGLAVGSITDCSVKTFGLVSCGGDKPLEILKENSIMKLASISKSFFAVLIACLSSDGYINLDSPLSEYSSSIQSRLSSILDNISKNKYNYLKITIRMLLSHTSGLSNTPRPYDNLFDIAFNPGTNWRYSSEGYIIVQYIIEKITGISLEELMKKYIFKPLSLSNTGYCIPNVVQGFNIEGNICKCSNEEKDKLAPGSLKSSISDLTRFLSFISSIILLRPFNFNFDNIQNSKFTIFTQSFSAIFRDFFNTITRGPTSNVGWVPGFGVYFDEITKKKTLNEASFLFHWGNLGCYFTFFWISTSDSYKSMTFLIHSANGMDLFEEITQKIDFIPKSSILDIITYLKQFQY